MAKVPIKIHEYAFLGKDFLKYQDAKISVMTHAFMYGTAVFEGIRAYYNKDKDALYLLHLRNHFERLLQSCKILRMQPYYDVDQMCELTIELLKKNKPKCDAYVRPSWFKSCERIGPSVICADSDDEDSFVMTSIDLGDYLDTSKGISVQISSWRRVSDNAIPPRAKINGSYVNTGLAKANAILAGYDDAIYLTEAGYVAEGSAMNLFIIRDGKLVTPRVSDNILEGITRNFISDLAIDELGLEVETRAIDRTELYIAEEAFFCGTGAQIVPIGFIDNYQLGNGKPGAITSKLQNLYNDIARGKVDKYNDCLIEVK
ncbi:MAG: branched-chain amino acid transaminase [Candidatus Melainabacteria bacterium]|nr:branched-chain amino acid transaminase [Candidatus Melainabacteria bacterium]